MVSLFLARQLHEAGLSWEPANGDRFVIDVDGLRGDVFMLSDMVVERARGRFGPIFKFNGTTEWALDSVEQSEAIWLPREDQLRAALGDNLVSLRRRDDGWTVTVHVGLSDRYVDGATAADAYAFGLLHVLAFPSAPRFI